MRRRAAYLLLAPSALLLIGVLAAPLLYLFSFSLSEGGAEPGTHGGFTVANYLKLAGDPYYLGIFANTLWMSATSTIIAAIVGFVLAYVMWRTPRRWRGLFTVVILSPLLVSVVVTSYGWVVILGKDGIINRLLLASGAVSAPLKMIFTDGAIVVGLVHIAIPFVALSTLAVLERIETVLPEAAATLGASPFRVFWHVILPLAAPGLIAGATIVFSLCLSAYVTPALLGGSGPNFITTLIFNHFVTLFDWPFGAALAAALLMLCFAIVLLSTSMLARFAGPKAKTA